MLKVRYSRVRLPVSLDTLATLAKDWIPVDDRRLRITRASAGELVINLTAVRMVRITEMVDDEPVTKPVPTMERHTFRLFAGKSDIYLSLLNPTRTSGVVEEVLDALLAGRHYAVEPLEIGQDLIARHTRKFAAARLVSAKIRDFKVYENAIGRLEVTSKAGLPNEIAPFLEGKFHRVDALTYEVTHDFTTGLIWYSSGGTVRVSGPLVAKAFPLFEEEL